jgi:hypothetical protein
LNLNYNKTKKHGKFSFQIRSQFKLVPIYLASDKINDLSQTLTLMRCNLKEELDFLMYLKNILINDHIKYLDIINKLETLILKDIEQIGEFITLILRNIVVEIDDKIYNRYEDLRESYNETLLNLQKVILYI